MFTGNLLCSSLCTLPLVPALKIAWPSPGRILRSGIYRHREDPLEPSLLLAEEPQLSQSFLIEVLQSLHQLDGPPRDSFGYVQVPLVLGSLELDTVLQVWPDQCWAEGKDHLPWPAGNTLPNEDQGSISFLRCKGTPLFCVQIALH